MSTPPTPPSRPAPGAAPSPTAPTLRLPPRPDPRGARAFAGIAEAFERGRPGYPQAAVHWLVRESRATVVDVGAGTGKLSREVLAAGHAVMAVEPVPEMLEQLRLAVPGASPVRARAEALPTVSRSVDVILAADSFHWFDAASFLSEATRALRPGGALGLLWNEPDTRVPWVRRLAALLGDDHLLADPGEADESRLPHAAVDDTGQFESVEQKSFRLWHRVRKTELRDLVASRPEITARGPVAVERLLEEVDDLFDDACAGSDLAMPLTTHCFRAAVLPWAYVGAPRRSPSEAPAVAVDAVPPAGDAASPHDLAPAPGPAATPAEDDLPPS